MHVCTTRARKGRTQKHLDHGSVYYISFLRRYPSRHRPVGAHRGGCRYILLPKWSYCPLCVAYLEYYLQSHFWLRAGTLCDEVRLLCGPIAKHCTCTHAPLNRTALRTEVCPTLVLGVRSACSPVPSSTHITGCCSIA